MHPLIERNRPAIEELCRRYSVRRLDLFGSAARGGFEPGTSDLDFLVVLEDLPPAEFAAAYFGLLEGLTDLLRTPVDLVSESAITNPYFRESVEQTREQLYAA